MKHSAVSISSIRKDYLNLESSLIEVCGWVRTSRRSKNVAFVEINDGSSLTNLQLVASVENIKTFPQFEKVSVGSAVKAKGILVLTGKENQPFELKIEDFSIIGESAKDYPLQKKHHTLEFLRTIAHLRPRTNTYSAIFRVRSAAAFAIHSFFNKEGFTYVHTPILTGSDCEGAGEMFTVTSFDLKDIQKNPKTGEVNYSEDFFGKHASLTVSGQLEGECMAMALGKIYTFGPTFRAEKSYTGRHAAEFWMIEPEMAFVDLEGNMQNAQNMIKYVVKYVLENCKQEIEFFNKFYERDLLNKLNSLVSSNFEKISYTKAIEILESSNENFQYKPSWGIDLQTEHERFLTEKIFKKPVFVVDYPKDIKSFYMKQNADGKTVAAMDLLAPGIGEIIGGSEREADYETLLNRMNELNLKVDDYWWYLDLRKYGSAVHSGYGLGFERLIMYLTGISNIRDALPFPRTTGNLEF